MGVARHRGEPSSFRGWKPSPSVHAHPTAAWCRIDRTLPREWGDWMTRVTMPSLRIPDFHMSSVSQAQ
jgi:hypothetical protein